MNDKYQNSYINNDDAMRHWTNDAHYHVDGVRHYNMDTEIKSPNKMFFDLLDRIKEAVRKDEELKEAKGTLWEGKIKTELT